MKSKAQAAAAYSAADAGVLVQLAAVAAGDLSTGPVLPPNWSLIATVPANPPAPAWAGGPQALLALGALSSGTNVVVLAVGMPWTTYLNQFTDGILTLQDVPGVITNAGSVLSPFAVQYGQVRNALWNALPQAGNYPIVITGMGLGGPLAQLAALDMNPKNKGPQKQNPPAVQPSCYVFASPPPGDAPYATLFTQTVPAGWTVAPTFLGSPIDQFATAPAGAGVVTAGTAQLAATTFPTPFDDPWVERGAWFYGAALGQPVTPPPPVAVTVSPPGTGLVPTQAASLARLCAYTYGLAQNPTAPQSNPAPYAPGATASYQGSIVASSFSSPSGYAIAFRGGITFADFGGIVAKSGFANAPFLGTGGTKVHAGALQVYTGIRTALLSMFQAVPAGQPLVLTGHDLGGALATLALADILANVTALGTPTTYTFGAVPVGGFNFAPAVGTAPIYNVMRPNDFMSQALNMGGFVPVGTAVTVNGTPLHDDPTAHSVTGYWSLFDPQGG
jgi:hypothetical protein